VVFLPRILGVHRRQQLVVVAFDLVVLAEHGEGPLLFSKWGTHPL
jgi:hypothetical protein